MFHARGRLTMRHYTSLFLSVFAIVLLSACESLPGMPASAPVKPAQPQITLPQPQVVATVTAVTPAEPPKPGTQAAQASATSVAVQQAAPNPAFLALSTQVNDLVARATALGPQITDLVTRVNGPVVKYSRELPGGIQSFGIPEKIPADKVNQVAEPYRNPLGVAPHVYGDPGGLIMEADAMDTTGRGNRYAVNGKNPGATVLYESGGSIRLASPVNRFVARESFNFDQNLPEGGFVEISSGQMSVYIPRDSANADPNLKYFALSMPYKTGHNYFFVARGLFPDGKQDTDYNRTMTVSNYKRGHIIADMYESRFETNLGFVSEEGLMQRAATSHSGGTNCGAEGCSGLTIVALDTNTGALEIWEQKLNQVEARAALADWRQSRKNWNRLYSNFR